jgi:transcription initiation factor TFIID subunit 5
MLGHEAAISSLEFSRNGEILASAGDDDSVRLWSVKEAETAPMFSASSPAPPSTSSTKVATKDPCLKSFYTKRTPVYSISFTKRNILVALGVFEK